MKMLDRRYRIYPIVKSNALLFAVLLLAALAGSAGAEWATKETGVTSDLNSVYFATRATGYAVGDGVIIKSTSGGASWETKLADSNMYYSVFFPSSLEGYVLGTDGTSGVALKTTDQGTSFTPMTFVGVSATAFMKGSSLGDFRAMVATKEGGADSVLIFSTDAGTAWATTELAGIQAAGVFLGPGATGDSTSCYRWVWGRKGSNFVILKDETEVYTMTATTYTITGVFAPSELVVYASLSDDRVIKTTDGGTTWDTLNTSSASDSINALYFISNDFGWVVGDAGYVSFTTDGGFTWISYILSDPFDINDIYVNLVGLTAAGASAASVKVNASTLALVFAYITGDGGKLAQLESPSITGVTPNLRAQGFIGTIEVSGSGFLEGASVSIEGGGVVIGYTSYESASRLISQILIQSDATVGARNLLVTNPDATASREVNAFTIGAGSDAVRFSNIWFDGNKYLSPEVVNVPRSTVNVLPFVSFEVSSDNGVTPESVASQLVGHYPIDSDYGTYIFTPIIPAANAIILSTTEVNVSYQFTGTAETLPSGQIIDLFLYANDEAGNGGSEKLLVSVAQPISDGIPSWGPTTPSGGLAIFWPRRNTWDPESEAEFPAVIQLTPGTSIKEFTLKILDYTGRQIYTKRFTYGPSGPVASDVKVTTTPSTSGFVTKYNFNIRSAELAPYISPGIYVVMVYDNSTGALLSKNTMVIAPSSMR